MRKHIKLVSICVLFAAVIFCISLISDREQLEGSLIRLHVVANSDREEDQNVKLRVRDAVIASIQSDLEDVKDVGQARAYLQENLPKIQHLADQVLEQAGFQEKTVVTLCREAFDTRVYDTFTLPAGVYEALRITIGEGEGHNWWCVAFPALCLPATSSGFSEVAVEAGFSDTMTKTLTGEDYQLRFYLLDALGRLENAFFDSH